MTQPVFRFAPSPNGRLHLGHAYSAILNHDLAKAAGGRFLVRIEDIDTVRCKPEYIDAALEDLRWLGLEWEEPVRRQSDHFQDYASALKFLERKGLIYPAFLSRAEIAETVGQETTEAKEWPHDPDGAPHYPGNERSWSTDMRNKAMSSGRLFGWRLDMAKALKTVGHRLFWNEVSNGRSGTIEADPAQWGDVLLARKDVPTSYHLSVVVDDALQGISHIVRGNDLYYATSIHRLLQELLGLPVPRYFHHELVFDLSGVKLAKSAGSTSLHDMRQHGTKAEDIRAMVGLAVRQTGSARL